MATVTLTNSSGSRLDAALQYVVQYQAVRGTNDPSTSASFGDYRNLIRLTGYGFTYDGANGLTGGVITGIDTSYLIIGAQSGSEAYGNLALTVADARALAASGGAVGALLAGADLVTVNAQAAKGYGGDDTFVVQSAGVPFGAFGQPAATVTAIDGGGGVNTAAFPAALRAAAVISGGGGTESVVQSGITANLVSIDRIAFIDGSVYEDNASAGAQAALIFEGLFGRLPDAINAGGYGRLAEQSGTVVAARAMLGTREAQDATAGLGTGDFVARLYRAMLHREPDAPGAAGWQAQLDGGAMDRATVAASFASTIEAQASNAAAFASASVFAADPSAVEVLRSYETLLNRAPEAGALIGNLGRLGSGAVDLAGLYRELQGSAEFAGTAHGNGLSATSSYAAIRGVALGDAITSTITPLVTSQGVAVHG